MKFKLSKNLKTGLRAAIVVAAVGLAYQNCGQFKPSQYGAAKADLINNSSVLGGGTRVPVPVEPAEDPRNQGHEGPNPTPTPTPNTPTPTPSTPTPGPTPTPVTPTPTPVTPTPTPWNPNPTPTPVTPTPTPTTPVVTPTPIPTPTPVTPTPTPATPTPTPTPPVSTQPPPTTMPIEMYCTLEGVQLIGDTLFGAPNALYYAIEDLNGNQVCQWIKADARDSLINTSKVVIDNFLDKCPGLKTGTYVATLKTQPSRQSILTQLHHAESYNDRGFIGDPVHVQIAVNADRSVTMVDTDQTMCEGIWGQMYAGLYGYNWLTYCHRDYGILAAKILWNTIGAQRCDAGVSPLVVQLNEKVEPIWLTKPLEGIRFDIMGQNAKPPHQPKLISWLTEESAPKNYFIVLPDESGEVRGIDQMFGDNTLGPDGKTPAKEDKPKLQNGYEALRKWDGRLEDGKYDSSLRDGFITARDPVFRKLRLWADVNRDGIAQKSELTTLDEHNVTAIDLNFDASWLETDEWGNQTRMKSVVITSDKKLHLMYDIWFRAL